MAVIRVNKTKDYTVMSNYHLRDRRLSLKAKGLLSIMFSLPDAWDYSIAGLAAICKERETAVKTTLDELKECGYLIVTKKMPNETASGRIEYEYNVYEQSQEKQAAEKQAAEKQGVENLGLEFLAVENQGQLNTKESNTKEVITKDKKKVSKKNSFDEIISNYANGNEELKELLGEWLKVRKAKRAAMTDRAIQMNIDKLDKLAADSKLSVTEYLKEIICRGWAAFYVINNYSKETGRKEAVPDWMKKSQFHNVEQRSYDYDDMTAQFINQVNQPKTAGENAEVAAKMAALQERIANG